MLSKKLELELNTTTENNTASEKNSDNLIKEYQKINDKIDVVIAQIKEKNKKNKKSKK